MNPLKIFYQKKKIKKLHKTKNPNSKQTTANPKSNQYLLFAPAEALAPAPSGVLAMAKVNL